MIYLELFWSFFQIGLFSFGGGYAAMPLINQIVVNSRGWMTLAEFSDVLTIAEMTPGSIAINATTFIGMRVAGFPGVLVATLGCILPSCIIIILLAYLWSKFSNITHVKNLLSGLRAAIVGMIATSGLTIILLSFFGNGISFDNISYSSILIFAATLFILRKFKINAIFLMLSSGVVGLILYGVIGINF